MAAAVVCRFYGNEGSIVGVCTSWWLVRNGKVNGTTMVFSDLGWGRQEYLRGARF